MPKAVGEDAWYLVIAAIIASSSSPELLGPFYQHLVKKDSIVQRPIYARNAFTSTPRRSPEADGAYRCSSCAICTDTIGIGIQAEFADPPSTPKAQASE